MRAAWAENLGAAGGENRAFYFILAIRRSQRRREMSPENSAHCPAEIPDGSLCTQMNGDKLCVPRSPRSQMHFNNMSGNGRAEKTVSFRISAPDSCNLKDKPEHMVARKYLKLWRLERV